MLKIQWEGTSKSLLLWSLHFSREDIINTHVRLDGDDGHEEDRIMGQRLCREKRWKPHSLDREELGEVVAFELRTEW